MFYAETCTVKWNDNSSEWEYNVPNLYLIKVKDNKTGKSFLDKTKGSDAALTKDSLKLAENRVMREMLSYKENYDRKHKESDLTIEIIEIGNECTTINVVKTFHFINGRCFSVNP